MSDSLKTIDELMETYDVQIWQRGATEDMFIKELQRIMAAERLDELKSAYAHQDMVFTDIGLNEDDVREGIYPTQEARIAQLEQLIAAGDEG